MDSANDFYLGNYRLFVLFDYLQMDCLDCCFLQCKLFSLSLNVRANKSIASCVTLLSLLCYHYLSSLLIITITSLVLLSNPIVSPWRLIQVPEFSNFSRFNVSHWLVSDALFLADCSESTNRPHKHVHVRPIQPNNKQLPCVRGLHTSDSVLRTNRHRPSFCHLHPVDAAGETDLFIQEKRHSN